MNITEIAMKTPQAPADAEFIEQALSELESYIVCIEQRHHVRLVGDRASFETARQDWRHFTTMQVAHAVSCWRALIFQRYSNIEKHGDNH